MLEEWMRSSQVLASFGIPADLVAKMNRASAFASTAHAAGPSSLAKTSGVNPEFFVRRWREGRMEKNEFDRRVVLRTVATLSVATFVPAWPVFGQPMPAGISLAAIHADEKERDRRENLPVIIQALQLAPGSFVADLGTGYGYYASRFSPIVGPTGRVFAEEISAPLLAKVGERMQADGRRNVTLVAGAADDPKFPDGALDAVIIADVYHEIERPGAVLSHLMRALKPGGRVMVVDYLKPEARSRSRKDQAREHNIAPEFVEQDLTAAGFSLMTRRDPYCTGYDGIPTYFVLARRK